MKRFVIGAIIGLLFAAGLAVADDFGGVNFIPRGIARMVIGSDGTRDMEPYTYEYSINKMKATLAAPYASTGMIQATLDLEAAMPTIVASAPYNKATINAYMQDNSTDGQGAALAVVGLTQTGGISNGKIWGALFQVAVNTGTDANATALELDVTNSGTDVSVLTGNYKEALLIVSDGAANATAAIQILNGGTAFHYGLVASANAFTAVTDPFLTVLTKLAFQNNGFGWLVGGLSLGSTSVPATAGQLLSTVSSSSETIAIQAQNTNSAGATDLNLTNDIGHYFRLFISGSTNAFPNVVALQSDLMYHLQTSSSISFESNGAARFIMANGMYSNGATGGDKGVDTLNALHLYKAGVEILPPIVPHTVTGATPTTVVSSATAATVDAQNLVLSANVTTLALPAAASVTDHQILHYDIRQSASGGPFTLPAGTVGPLTAGSGTIVTDGTGGGNCTIGSTQSATVPSEQHIQVVYYGPLTEWIVLACTKIR